jgi:hypothetical protein
MFWATVESNHIGGVIVSVLNTLSVNRGFEPWLSKTQYHVIDMCFFSTTHTALQSKNKHWLVLNLCNVSRVEQHVYQWTDVLVI